MSPKLLFCNQCASLLVETALLWAVRRWSLKIRLDFNVIVGQIQYFTNIKKYGQKVNILKKILLLIGESSH